MPHSTLKPIDMPHDDLGSYQGFDDEMRAALTQLVEDAYAAGRWRTPEDILWNPRDPEFMAYWAQKCVNPITEPMKGAGLKEYFEPFRKARFDLKPAGFTTETEYRFSAVGDLMPAIHIEDSKDGLYRHVEDLIFGADCAFANLECTIAPGELRNIGDFEVGGTPILNVTRDQFEVLTHHKQSRFDVLQLANNHVLDAGEAGILASLEAMKQSGIEHIGVFETEALANTPKVLDVGSVKVGWIAHTYCVNEKPLPDGKPWMVDVTPFHVERSPDLSRLLSQIEDARQAGCDIVIVCLHWGAEWEFYPLPVQLDWAHQIAEAGADAIIGTHPHVIQPVEIYRPENAPWKSVPILYSLGNLTPTMSAAYTTLSIVANLAIGEGHLGGDPKKLVTALELTPVAFLGEEVQGKTRAACVPLRDLKGHRLDSAMQTYVDELSSFSDLVLGTDWR
ncbi:CapA family protein [Actibacterium pelagium]|uniref:Capsule synthesis protein CapA domain-containing protein n=1 Tax=Actibacterium pelagium TaxID=2029103 RepID=A0A917AGF3_9RHOB|nr:CapA family protein [Actibacterium pelagium]GGE50948.1 hypothetical protein GCM10011517_18410 [Actibacterium pelagium]